MGDRKGRLTMGDLAQDCIDHSNGMYSSEFKDLLPLDIQVIFVDGDEGLQRARRKIKALPKTGLSALQQEFLSDLAG